MSVHNETGPAVARQTAAAPRSLGVALLIIAAAQLMLVLDVKQLS